jgi:hypothetical protein
MHFAHFWTDMITKALGVRRRSFGQIFCLIVYCARVARPADSEVSDLS